MSNPTEIIEDVLFSKNLLGQEFVNVPFAGGSFSIGVSIRGLELKILSSDNSEIREYLIDAVNANRILNMLNNSVLPKNEEEEKYFEDTFIPVIISESLQKMWNRLDNEEYATTIQGLLKCSYDKEDYYSFIYSKWGVFRQIADVINFRLGEKFLRTLPHNPRITFLTSENLKKFLENLFYTNLKNNEQNILDYVSNTSLEDRKLLIEKDFLSKIGKLIAEGLQMPSISDADNEIGNFKSDDISLQLPPEN